MLWSSRIPASQGVVLAFVLTCWSPPALGEDPPADAILADLAFLESEAVNQVVIDLAPEGNTRRLRMLVATGRSGGVWAEVCDARAMGIRQTERRRSLFGKDLDFKIHDSRSSPFVIGFGRPCPPATGFESGVVGGGWLSQYVVELDFPGRRVRFIDPERYGVPESVSARAEAVVPLQAVHGRPTIELTVNGHPALVLLDTGSPLPLQLAQEVAERAHLAHVPVPHLGREDEPVALEFGEARRVQIGPFELESLPVEVLPRYDIDPESLNIEGRLGIDALSQFVVRLDPSRGRMWLRRNPMARNTLLGMDYELFKASGTLLVPVKGGWLVSMVLPASPGLRRGLELGDRITTERSLEEVIDMIRGPGEIIVVRVMDGVEATLRLAP